MKPFICDLRDFRNYKKSMIIQCMEPNLTYPLDSRSRAPFCVRPSISKIWRHHCTLGEKHLCEFSAPSHCTSAHPRKSSLLQCFKIAYFDVVFILYIHIISSKCGQFFGHSRKHYLFHFSSARHFCSASRYSLLLGSASTAI